MGRQTWPRRLFYRTRALASFREGSESINGFCALGKFRNQCDSDMPFARVDAVDVTSEIAAGEYGDGLFCVQAPGELCVVSRSLRPEIARAIGARCVQYCVHRGF